MKQVNIGDPVRLTSNPAQDLDPAWSPDRRQIAFVRRAPDRQELLVVNPLGGAERKIADIQATQTPWPVDAAGYVRHLGSAWSPEGSQIATADTPVAGEPDSIYLFNVETGERRRLTSPPRPDEADSQPVFSRRGRFSSHLPAACGGRRSTPTGSRQRATGGHRVVCRWPPNHLFIRPRQRLRRPRRVSWRVTRSRRSRVS